MNVVTTMLMNNADPKTKEKVATLMTVTANDMVYVRQISVFGIPPQPAEPAAG